MQIKKRYPSMSLKRKVRIMFLYMMGAFLVFCLYIFYLVLDTKMESSALEAEANNWNVISKNLNGSFDSINSISRQIMIGSGVRAYLKEKEITAANMTAAGQDVFNVLHSFNIPCNVSVFRNDKKHITTGVGVTYISRNDVSDGNWLFDVRERRGGYVIKSNKEEKVFLSNVVELITFARVINDIQTQKEIGILAINIPTQFFDQIYADLNNDKNHFALYDNAGYLISSDDPEIFEDFIYPKGTDNQQKRTRSFFHEKISTVNKLEDSGFIFVSVSKVSLLEGLSPKIMWALLGGVVILLFSIIRINLYIARNVTTPIQKLVKSMTGVQNGLLHRVSINVNDDEIGHLKNSYNGMLVEINHLIEELINKEKNLQKAEMHALQEQIKPHFLYNTLDMIRYFAMNKDLEKVNDLLETLGNFYRKFLSKGRIDIPLSEEIDIVKSYLTLQKIRYDGTFDDEYDIQSDISGIWIPRLILQPLVENSIYHGLQLKGEKGLIRITVYKDECLLHIKIYDSGIGMTNRQVIQLMYGKDKTGFGFKGTMERLRYYYKEDDVFEVQSTEGEFCEVELKLPLKGGKIDVSGNDN